MLKLKNKFTNLLFLFFITVFLGSTIFFNSLFFESLFAEFDDDNEFELLKIIETPPSIASQKQSTDKILIEQQEPSSDQSIKIPNQYIVVFKNSVIKCK